MAKRIPRVLAGLFLCAATQVAQAGPADLVMIAPLNHTMPLAQFQNATLSGGILKELGDAIGARLGRKTRYLSVAGGDVAQALAKGKADGLCYVMPFWIDGDFNWSIALIPDAELIASREAAPRIRSLTDLRNTPIGTVANYRYPRVEKVLEANFVRADSDTMEQNLRKVMAGEVAYTIIGKVTMAYQMRINKTLKLRPELVFASYKAQCAFSRRSSIPFADAERAIAELDKDGSVERILARYR